jgi:hypothetical protein
MGGYRNGVVALSSYGAIVFPVNLKPTLMESWRDGRDRIVLRTSRGRDLG